MRPNVVFAFYSPTVSSTSPVWTRQIGVPLSKTSSDTDESGKFPIKETRKRRRFFPGIVTHQFMGFAAGSVLTLISLQIVRTLSKRALNCFMA